MTSSIKTPKYYPNQPDILTANDNQSVPDSIKTISRTVSLSSSFNKTNLLAQFVFYEYAWVTFG